MTQPFAPTPIPQPFAPTPMPQPVVPTPMTQPQSTNMFQPTILNPHVDSKPKIHDMFIFPKPDVTHSSPPNIDVAPEVKNNNEDIASKLNIDLDSLRDLHAKLNKLFG